LHLFYSSDIRRENSEYPDEQPVKKKRGRKRKSELKVNRNELRILIQHIPIILDINWK